MKEKTPGEKINKRRKPVPERSGDSQIREIELKPISGLFGDAAKYGKRN